MTSAELALYLKLLPNFKAHYEKNPFSTLARIFGVFTVRSRATQPVHIILMENTLRFKKIEDVRYIFDLKGSLVDRKTKGSTKRTTVLKDINWLDIMSRRRSLVTLQMREKLHIKKIVHKDVEFLQSLGLMDYSMLVGIEKMKQSNVAPPQQ